MTLITCNIYIYIYIYIQFENEITFAEWVLQRNAGNKGVNLTIVIYIYIWHPGALAAPLIAAILKRVYAIHIYIYMVFIYVYVQFVFYLRRLHTFTILTKSTAFAARNNGWRLHTSQLYQQSTAFAEWQNGVFTPHNFTTNQQHSPNDKMASSHLYNFAPNQRHSPNEIMASSHLYNFTSNRLRRASN